MDLARLRPGAGFALLSGWLLTCGPSCVQVGGHEFPFRWAWQNSRSYLEARIFVCPTASCEKEVLYPGVPWIRSLENFTGEWLLSCDHISCVDICGGSQGNWVLPSDQTTSSLWVVAFLCAWISLAHPVRSRALVPGELDQEKMLGPKVVEMCPVAAATV